MVSPFEILLSIRHTSRCKEIGKSTSTKNPKWHVLGWLSIIIYKILIWSGFVWTCVNKFGINMMSIYFKIHFPVFEQRCSKTKTPNHFSDAFCIVSIEK